MKTYELENRSNGHFKFYRIYGGVYVDQGTGKANEAFVGMRYGRIGTEGRQLFKTFTGRWCKAEALRFLEAKVEEKLNRGYQLVSSSEE